MSARDEMAALVHSVGCPDCREDPMTYDPRDFAIADAILAAGWVKPPGPCPECHGLPGTNVRQHQYWCKTVEGIVQHGQVYD